MVKLCEFDIVVYGVIGYIGCLVVEYMVEIYGGMNVFWVMVGCNLDKLVVICDELGVLGDMLFIKVDVSDLVFVQVMVEWVKVVFMMVGFYIFYGEFFVVVCVKVGIDYVDLSGEFVWMCKMIDVYEVEVKFSGVCIVFLCGFDFIFFDFGVYFF